MIIWPEEWSEQDGNVTVRAVLEDEDKARQSLWYRVPAEWKSALTRSCDPFVVGAIFSAMTKAERLEVRGEVSPSLLRNLDEFQSAWLLWRPKQYHKLDIVAEVERETPSSEKSASVMTFSGGVDSSFTAWRHRAGQGTRQKLDITAGVMVHGFDIPVGQPEVFARAAENSSRMLASIGLRMIPLTTNFRELRGHWEDTHGAALASCLTLLQGGFTKGVIASSYPYSALILPYGSNPVTDRMLGSERFPILHDGAGFMRLEKSRALLEWPEALKHLRVCWQGEHKDRNCGRCQKCVSNILYFRIAGRQHIDCFDRELTDDDIARIQYTDKAMLESSLRLVRVARAEGVTGSWVDALERSCRHYGWKRFLRVFRRKRR